MANPEMAYGVPMVSVVAGALCVPYPVELIIKKKHHGLFDVCYQVLDVNGNLFFQLDGSYKALRKKRIMCDSSGFPVLMMREKAIIRQHWTVHRGESKDRNGLLFSVRQSHSFNMETKLDVFSASNINEDISNFQVVRFLSLPILQSLPREYSHCSCNCHAPNQRRNGRRISVSYNLSWTRFCKGTKEDFKS